MVITNPELGLHIVWGTLSSTQARPAFGLDLGFILGQWAASWARSISKEVNLSKTEVIFRTYAPVHFRLFPCCVWLLSFCILFCFLLIYFFSLVNPALTMIGNMPPISWLPLLFFLLLWDFFYFYIWHGNTQAFFSG